MGTLVNDDIPSMETPEKRLLEKIDAKVPTLAYKRQKVSAKREFPQGCGRYALKINKKPSEDSVVGPVKNSKSTTDAFVDTIGVKPLGDSVEPESLDTEKTIAVESLQLSKSLLSETRKLIEGSDAAEWHDQINFLGIPMVLDDIENPNQSKTLEPGISELSKPALPKCMKYLDGPVATSLLRSAQPEEKELLVLQPPLDLVSSDLPVQVKFSDQSQASLVIQALEASTSKKFPPRRKTRACRDFPVGCEKNAPCVLKGECKKSVVSSADKNSASVMKEECENSVISSKVRSFMNGTCSSIGCDSKQITDKVGDGDALVTKLNSIATEGSEDEFQAVSDGGVQKVITEHIHVKVTSESKLKREGTPIKCNRSLCESDISSPGLTIPPNSGKVDLGFHNDRVVVQCLLAAPNCPSMQEKKGFKQCSLIPGTEKKKSLRRGSACRDFPQGGERNAPCAMKEECQKSVGSSPDNGLAIVMEEECQKSDDSSPDSGLTIITKDEYEKSVVMEDDLKSAGSSTDRSLVIITEEEYQQSVMSSKGRSFINKKEQAVGDDTKQPSAEVREGDAPVRKLECVNIKEFEGSVRELSKGELNKETIEHNHVNVASEINLKRRTRSSDRSLCENDISLSDLRSPSKKEKSDLGFCNGRAVVQCLTAAKNCPLVQEIQGVESPSVTRPTTRSKMKKQEFKSPEESKKQELESSEEVVLLDNVTGPKRKDSGKSVDECYATNQSKGQECVDLGFFNEDMVVQCLMAAANSPWSQGKQGFKSPSILANGTTRSEGKNQVVLVKDSTKSTSKRKKDDAGTSKGKSTKNNKDEEGTSKGKSTKKKVSPTTKAAHEGGNQLVLNNLNDFPCDDNNSDKSNSVVTRKKVKESLRLFQAIYRKLMQEEEAKSKEGKVNSSGRLNLVCATARILKEKNKWVNTGKQILGSVPGVDVGDEFHYRAELAVIGLHHQFQGGIDYLTGRNLATSIVASGGYGDDVDSSDVLRYSGQGGNPTGADKKAEDQKLVRGNLALKNSLDERSPVRVIRGFKENKKDSATYVYDGLYMVERFWQETGCHGNKVYMFELRRIPGQPELALKELKSKKGKVREGLCLADISEGKEKMPICAFNTIDHEKPPLFKYTPNIIYPPWYNCTPPRGCECTNGCSDSAECLCAVRNGGEIPYNHDGAIVEAKHLVYECGPSCKCPPSCHNRVSQRGIQFQLEIFKTESRGWGVRSPSSIPSGSFICEYTGELLQDTEAEERTGNDEYLFDIGNNYNDPFWEGVSTVMSSDFKTDTSGESVEDADFTIDAAQCGSIGRFINHSCSPNLYAQNVLYDHEDKRMPHIMLFATENIPPLQELTYHYNYQLDQVRDSDGNIKKKDCYCGAVDCTGRLY